MNVNAHVKRIEPGRKANSIHNFQENRNTEVLWTKEEHRDLEECMFTEEM